MRHCWETLARLAASANRSSIHMASRHLDLARLVANGQGAGPYWAFGRGVATAATGEPCSCVGPYRHDLAARCTWGRRMRDGTRGKNLIVQHPDKPDRSSRFRREAGPRGGKRILGVSGGVCHGESVIEPTIARPRAVARRVASPLLSFRSLFETAGYAGIWRRERRPRTRGDAASSPNAAIVGSIGRPASAPGTHLSMAR
jgi:hypothetical protein